MTGLEKVAVLLRSLPPGVVDKVLRHLEPRQAGLVMAEVARLHDDSDLNKGLAGVLDEAVIMLGEASRPTAERAQQAKGQSATPGGFPAATDKAAAPKEPANSSKVDIRIAGNDEARP